MKVSKQRLTEIIKEELESLREADPAPTETPPEAEEASPETKTAMAKKFRELYSLFPKIQGLDASEIKLLDILLTGGIKAAKEGNAKNALTLAVQKLGVDINE